MQGKVLVIAGSDSSGGAGIQADIKTITCLGGYAMTAITAITAQNTQGVHGIFAVPPAMVTAQINACLTDITPDVIKIGMVHCPETIMAIVGAIARQTVPVILDPVMIAKGGASLLTMAAEAVLREQLLPLCTVITPNIPEAERLTGQAISCLESMRQAGKQLQQQTGVAVMLKGGHLPLEGIVTDMLFTAAQQYQWQSPYSDSRHTHGTGCTLASAVAVGMAQGLSLPGAISRARDFVQQAIRDAPQYGSGHGPLGHGFMK